jgi:sugar phosphate isomerase/epimerase
MVWRIGDILDVDEQIEWIRTAGFRGVSFHAHAGHPGGWQGVDPSACDAERRRQLREKLAAFEMCEIHAPFASTLKSGSLPATLEALVPVLELAGDVGASIVTVHASLPDSSPEESGSDWQEAMRSLNAAAADCATRIGLEVVSGFEQIRQWDFPNIGVTLDIGHMYAADGGLHLQPFGTIGELVRRIGEKLIHLHVHDYDGTADHIEIGRGRVDFDGMLEALKDIGYRGAMCLEMNPTRVSPEGIIRSRAWLERKMRQPGLC